jgi:hypothetical protein
MRFIPRRLALKPVLGALTVYVDPVVTTTTSASGTSSPFGLMAHRFRSWRNIGRATQPARKAESDPKLTLTSAIEDQRPRPLARSGVTPANGSVGRVIGNTARTCSAHIWQKAVA